MRTGARTAVAICGTTAILLLPGCGGTTTPTIPFKPAPAVTTSCAVSTGAPAGSPGFHQIVVTGGGDQASALKVGQQAQISVLVDNPQSSATWDTFGAGNGSGPSQYMTFVPNQGSAGTSTITIVGTMTSRPPGVASWNTAVQVELKNGNGLFVGGCTATIWGTT
jgi:hypothetical protein